MSDSERSLLLRLEDCTLCPRLVAHRQAVALEAPRRHARATYWGRPVPGLGDPASPLWLVGLAPSAHGANRTGRMFTGDASAAFLARALFEAGVASLPTSEARDDGFVLAGTFITAAVRCAPPGNRPLAQEIARCRRYLDAEWRLGASGRKSIVALGVIALRSVSALLDDQKIAYPPMHFEHGAKWDTGEGVRVFATYHPSPQNTNTHRLTMSMMLDVLLDALSYIGRG